MITYLNTITINPGANPTPMPVINVAGRSLRFIKTDWLGRWVYRP